MHVNISVYRDHFTDRIVRHFYAENQKSIYLVYPMKTQSQIHTFYHLPLITQWSVAIFMLLCMLTMVVYWISLVYEFPLAYFTIVLIAPFMQFLATPALTLIGVYRYLSPMLLVYLPTDQRYDLHNGTSFDYLFLMRKFRRGRAIRYQLLRYYMEGLLHIIDKIESDQLPETVVIRGSSYFFSDRSARRLGFSVRKAKFHEQINIVINYVDLTWMYSIAHGKLIFPKLNRIKTATIKGSELVQHKSQLKNILAALES